MATWEEAAPTGPWTWSTRVGAAASPSSPGVPEPNEKRPAEEPPHPRAGGPAAQAGAPSRGGDAPVDRTSPSGGDRSSEEGSSEESSPSEARSSGEEAHGTCDKWERRSRRRVVDPCRDGERPPSSESAGRPQAEGE